MRVAPRRRLIAARVRVCFDQPGGTMRRVSTGSWPLTIVVVVAATSCGQGNPEDLPSIQFGIGGGDFAGNSIPICGARNPPADATFRCDSVLPPESSTIFVPGPMGEPCPCFDF